LNGSDPSPHQQRERAHLPDGTAAALAAGVGSSAANSALLDAGAAAAAALVTQNPLSASHRQALQAAGLAGLSGGPPAGLGCGPGGGNYQADLATATTELQRAQLMLLRSGGAASAPSSLQRQGAGAGGLWLGDSGPATCGHGNMRAGAGPAGAASAFALASMQGAAMCGARPASGESGEIQREAVGPPRLLAW
jgi:hypothetical protein